MILEDYEKIGIQKEENEKMTCFKIKSFLKIILVHIIISKFC
jgi:hypothetical protein